MNRDIIDDPAVRAALEPGEQVYWCSRPGAKQLFLSVLPRLARDIVFLIFVGFAIYADQGKGSGITQLVVVMLFLFLVWLLVRNLQEGTAAKLSFYLVTDRRIVLITPRAPLKRFVILANMPRDREQHQRARWIDGKPLVDRVTSGRATLRIGYIVYESRSTNNYPAMAYRRHIVPLYGVEAPDEAIAAIARLRRDHRSNGRD